MYLKCPYCGYIWHMASYCNTSTAGSVSPPAKEAARVLRTRRRRHCRTTDAVEGSRSMRNIAQDLHSTPKARVWSYLESMLQPQCQNLKPETLNQFNHDETPSAKCVWNLPCFAYFFWCFSSKFMADRAPVAIPGDHKRRARGCVVRQWCQSEPPQIHDKGSTWILRKWKTGLVREKLAETAWPCYRKPGENPCTSKLIQRLLPLQELHIHCKCLSPFLLVPLTSSVQRPVILSVPSSMPAWHNDESQPERWLQFLDQIHTGALKPKSIRSIAWPAASPELQVVWHLPQAPHAITNAHHFGERLTDLLPLMHAKVGMI